MTPLLARACRLICLIIAESAMGNSRLQEQFSDMKIKSGERAVVLPIIVMTSVTNRCLVWVDLRDCSLKVTN